MPLEKKLYYTSSYIKKISRIWNIVYSRVPTHSYGKEYQRTEAKIASGSSLVQNVQGYSIQQCLPKHKWQELQPHGLGI